jgi:hypothetical protein
MIDGGSGYIRNGELENIPNFILAPNPHPEDADFRKSLGKDYYPENQLS